MGFESGGGSNFGFLPIDLRRRPYNTLARKSKNKHINEKLLLRIKSN